MKKDCGIVGFDGIAGLIKKSNLLNFEKDC